MRVIVTGGNSGVGRATASAMAAAGHEIVIGCRDLRKGREAASSMSGDVEVRELDLADLTSVRKRIRKRIAQNHEAVASSLVLLGREWRNHVANAETVAKPVGVVGAIVPWNTPLFIAALKLGPALAAGRGIAQLTRVDPARSTRPPGRSGERDNYASELPLMPLKWRHGRDYHHHPQRAAIGARHPRRPCRPSRQVPAGVHAPRGCPAG